MKESHRPYDIISVIVIIGMLLLPSLLMIWHPNTDKDASGENRELAERPTLAHTPLNQFPAKYDQYFNDHFPFRDHFINQYFSFRLSNGQSPNSAVIIGKDNFLFSGKREKELYEGALEEPHQKMQAVVEELSKRHARLQQMGIQLYVVVAPTAFEVYPEYLPNNILRADSTATDLLCRKVKTQAPQIPFLYLKEYLTQHKARHRIDVDV